MISIAHGLTLAEWADAMAAIHEQFYAKAPHGELMPQCMTVRAGGEGEIFGFPFRNDFERSMMLLLLRARLADPEIVRYAIWHEAWMVARVADPQGAMPADLLALAKARKLHAQPDRIEAVFTICIARDPAVEPASVAQKIIRDSAGRVRRLERLDAPGAGPTYIGGEFAKLFPQPTEH